MAILSERALSTDWMRAELELLRDRAQRDPRFVLVALASDEEQVRAMTDLGLPSWSIMFQDGDPGRQIEAAMLLLRPLPERVAAASTGGGTVLRAGEHEGAIHAVAIAMRDGRACAVTGDVVGTLWLIGLESAAGLYQGRTTAMNICRDDTAPDCGTPFFLDDADRALVDRRRGVQTGAPTGGRRALTMRMRSSACSGCRISLPPTRISRRAGVNDR